MGDAFDDAFASDEDDAPANPTPAQPVKVEEPVVEKKEEEK